MVCFCGGGAQGQDPSISKKTHGNTADEEARAKKQTNSSSVGAVVYRSHLESYVGYTARPTDSAAHAGLVHAAPRTLWMPSQLRGCQAPFFFMPAAKNGSMQSPWNLPKPSTAL